MLIEDVRGAKSEVVSCRCVAEWWGAGSGRSRAESKAKAEKSGMSETGQSQMMRLESEARLVVIGFWCGGATDKLLLHLAGPDRPGQD